jgi:glycosyltransferase involved in cell wall biosynthesis
VINVVVVAAVRPEWTNLLAAVEGLRQAGAAVRVACAFDPSGLPTDGLAGVRRLAVDLGRLRDGRRPRRFTPAWAWLVVRNKLVRARIRRSSLPLRTWLLARYDPWIREHAARADALVALEQRGVYAVWRLARENDRAAAMLGMEPLRTVAGDLQCVELISGKGRLRHRTAAEVPGAWGSALATFGRSRRVQLLTAAPRVVRTLRRLRAVTEAESVAGMALAEGPDRETASWLRLEMTAAQITAAVEPQYPLAAMTSDVLAGSDDHVRAGQIDTAAELAISVAEAIFNRELHAEVRWSPLTDDPVGFLAPLRSSLTFRALAAPAGSLRAEVASDRTATPAMPADLATPPSETADDAFGLPRLLVVSDGNLHFAKGILDDLTHPARAALRCLMLNEEVGRFGRRDTTSMIADRLGEAIGCPVPDLEPEEAELLRWPDTVFVDWCDNAAMWALLHVPREVRLVVRLHSIEALSHQPHMMDWSRVSDLIFVGAHVRDFMLRAIPTMARAGQVHVLPNEMRLARFAQPKRPLAAWTIAMVGWGQKVKDAAWALEVLSRLRAIDLRWRLMLIGRDFADSQTISGARYREHFRERIQRDDVRDGVVYVAHTDDLPEVLRDAGFVLNSSLRESFGVGLCEGAASAAVPVVRDWPLYTAYGGARAVYPSEWVVGDVDEAVRRIVEHTPEPARQEAGILAQEHVAATFDWTVVAPRYRSVLLGKKLDRTAQTRRRIPAGTRRQTGRNASSPLAGGATNS